MFIFFQFILCLYGKEKRSEMRLKKHVKIIINLKFIVFFFYCFLSSILSSNFSKTEHEDIVLQEMKVMLNKDNEKQ